MKYETGSIRQIHQRLLSEGYCISESTLRAWIRQGVLPAAFCGKKAYVCYSNVLRILHEGTLSAVADVTEDGIRKIN